MANRPKYPGVTPYKNGWQYRIKIKVDDRVVDTRIKYDSDGNPFLKARDAFEAKEAHILKLKEKPLEAPVEAPVTLLKDIYENYLKTEALGKSAATLRKQQSMWTNHVSPVFGDLDVNSISVVDLSSFLLSLYETHSYYYVEGFLKFFYLLFGHAHRLDLIDDKKYYKNFVDRDTRLSMPPKNQADYEDDLSGVDVYDDIDLHRIEKVFDSEDGNLLLSFYLGLYCGLRISECFGLRWSNINWQDRTITINRQMTYFNGEIRLSPVKTLNSVRTVLIPSKLYSELDFAYSYQLSQKEKLGYSYRDTERVFDEVSKELLVGSDFINRKSNGELLTVNSMKYWSRKIKSETGIDFKYHNLRHTFATRAAASNVTLTSLMGFLGHKKIDTTRKYYINVDSKFAKDRNLRIIESMYEGMDKPYGIDITKK